MSRRNVLTYLQALHFKKMLKTAGHEKKVKKVKVKETEVEPYKEAYEVSLHSGR
jgi:ATP-dependent RNA helicase DDX51/DBP6